jgi:hypothetical protein
MNLFWAIAGNMTAARHFESLHRFKTLPICAKVVARFCQCQADFAGSRVESFPLREIGHDVSVRAFATPTALETSAV